MRIADLFRRPAQPSPRYIANAPLFPFDAGVFPLAAGTYRNRSGGTAIGFRIEGDRYRMLGDVAPDTVSLIPVAGHRNGYVFQQSDGIGTAFYGALRMEPGEPGFTLFSPESLPAEAVRLAQDNGAAPGQAGCVFATRTELLSALVPLAFGAPEKRWDVYRPDGAA